MKDDVFALLLGNIASIIPSVMALLTCFMLLCMYISNKRTRSDLMTVGTRSDAALNSNEVSLNVLSRNIENPQRPVVQPSIPVRKKKELPMIPVTAENSRIYKANLLEQRLGGDISNDSSESEKKYYSTTNEGIYHEDRILDQKDVSIIMVIKIGKIHNRWTGSINIPGGITKCVVLTTMADRVKKKTIHWDAFIKLCLELPKTEHIVKVEAISIQKKYNYLITEHLVCETLKSKLSRTGDESAAASSYGSLSIPDVIQHVAGILEAMDILKSFGFLHPGLSTRKILITHQGVCKLYDFCLAGDAPKIAALIKQQMMNVSLNEFPPEMLLSSEYTESSDVWSTAVVIYEIMSGGNPPFPDSMKPDKDMPATTPSWPTTYKELKNNALFESWSHNCSLRPSIHHLRGTFLEIFEKIIEDGSYEIPIPTMYIPMPDPYDVTDEKYQDHIYHAWE
ncbi:tyrosine-protein kinase SRK3-like isoform X1 [Apostichopus japonicus]